MENSETLSSIESKRFESEKPFVDYKLIGFKVREKGASISLIY